MMSPITPPSITTKRTLVASTPTSSSSPSLVPYDWYEYDTPLIQTLSWPHEEEKDVTKESTETTPPPPPNRKRSLTEENSSSPSLVETISTCPTHSLTHHHHHDDDDNDENDYSIITAPLLCSRDKMLHTLPKLVPTRGTKGVSCSASTCTTDAIYQNCEEEEEEEEDVVSSIGSPSTFSTLDEEEEEEVARQSSLMTTPNYNKRGHGASFSMSLPWDAESQVRLHTLEHQEPRRLHPQLECFGDSLHYSLSSSSSSQEYQTYEEESMPSTPSSSSSSSGKKKKEVTYTSSSPLHRKCVLQEAELRAMTAETNAMLIREELHWIPHVQLRKVLKQDSRHFLSSPAKTIATTSSDGGTTTTTTTTKEDVLPYDCDPSPEESEEEEEVHADLRFLTLREVQDATARARWDCRKMERIVGCAQRAAGRAREYSCALEVQDGRYYSSSFRRRQRRRRRVEGEYHSEKRVQGMPTLQILLLLLKITTLLLLTFFTLLSLDLLLTIFYTKLKLCHEFFLHYTQNVFLSFWDVVALGMVVCVATADIAVVSSGFWRWSWRWGLVVEECEHPCIDEIEIVKEGKS